MTSLRPAWSVRRRHRRAREIADADLLAIDQGDDQPIGQPGPKFFKEIERQRWTIRPVSMKKADERIDTDGRECRDAIVPHQGVEK